MFHSKHFKKPALPELRFGLTISSLFVLFAHGGVAAAEERISVDTGVNAGISSSPFLTGGIQNDGASPYLEFSLAPLFVIEDEKSSTVLNGFVRYTIYASHYDSTSEGHISLTHQRKLSSTLDAVFSIGFESSVLGQRNAPGEITVVDPPIDDPGLTDPDVSLVGFRQRVQNGTASVRLAYDLNEIDTLSGDLEYNRAHYPNLLRTSNYQSLIAIATYVHRLSEHTSIGATMNGERIWYEANGGDYEIYRPQLTYATHLSTTWSLDVAAGALVINGSDLGGSFTSWSYSASVNLCRKDELSHFCAGVARDAAASGLDGVRNSLDAYARYSRRLNEDLSVNLSSRISRYASGRLQSSSATLWETDGGLQIILSPRAIARASVGVRTTNEPPDGHLIDVYGQGGISFRLGSLR